MVISVNSHISAVCPSTNLITRKSMPVAYVAHDRRSGPGPEIAAVDDYRVGQPQRAFARQHMCSAPSPAPVDGHGQYRLDDRIVVVAFGCCA
jgi:hypothetical protein